MDANEQDTKAMNAEIAGLLTAISIVAKRLAENVSKLQTEQEVESNAGL
jgi:hypothetical protein